MYTDCDHSRQLSVTVSLRVCCCSWFSTRTHPAPLLLAPLVPNLHFDIAVHPCVNMRYSSIGDPAEPQHRVEETRRARIALLHARSCTFPTRWSAPTRAVANANTIFWSAGHIPRTKTNNIVMSIYQMKRKRANSQDKASLPRRSELWFREGTVVLQAGNTQFRVYRDVLSLHSKIFKGMFSVSQCSLQDEALVEGCPLVRLCDSESDMEDMLRELYSYRSVQLHHTAPLSGRNITHACPTFTRPHTPDQRPRLSYLAAMLRLGKKYFIDDMQFAAANQLRRCFPTTLRAFDESPPVGQVYAGSAIDSMVQLLNVAQDTGLWSIMPAALYMSDLTVEEVFEGVDLDDGSTLLLHPDLQKRLLVGRDRLRSKQADGIYSWTRTNVAGCQDQAKCGSAKQARLLKLTNISLEDAAYFMPWNARWGEGLCSTCIEDAMVTSEVSREGLWEELPSIWGLPPWNQLRANDR